MYSRNKIYASGDWQTENAWQAAQQPNGNLFETAVATTTVSATTTAAAYVHANLHGSKATAAIQDSYGNIRKNKLI